MVTFSPEGGLDVTFKYVQGIVQIGPLFNPLSLINAFFQFRRETSTEFSSLSHSDKRNKKGMIENCCDAQRVPNVMLVRLLLQIM